MGFLSDVFDFEKFHLKDMWEKVKDDPERLFIGAIEPASSEMWGSILGKDYEPLVDQMGGAYGGNVISGFGNADAGVYGRAKEAGIDTTAGGQMQDAAHVIAAFYALGGGNLGGGGGGGSGGGSAGGGSTGGGWQQYARMMPQGGGGQQQQRPPPEPPPDPAFPQPLTDSSWLQQEEERRRQMLAQELMRGSHGLV